MIRSFIESDLNYIIESHYRIYHSEYGFDRSFREFITESVYAFMESYDREKEHIFILEINGEPKGCVGIIKIREGLSQLRWFLLEPELRGKGWGRELIKKAVDFARTNQYKSIFLWTNNNLAAARKLYELYGFSIVEQRKQILSNQEILEERWELKLME